MNKNIKAKDIMTTNPLVLTEEMSVEVAINLLTEKNAEGAPVLSTNNVIVGFFSVHDVMVDLWCQFYTPSKEQTVSDLMTKDVTFIDINEPLFNIIEQLCIDKKQLYPTSNMGIGTANQLTSISIEERAKKMAITKHQILPVLDNGALKGIITRVEIAKALRPIYSQNSTEIEELACA